MGTSGYNSPGVKGYIKDNETGQLEMLNSPKVQLAVEKKGKEFIDVARGVYVSRSRHDDEAPIYYLASFNLEHALKGVVRMVEVWNYDPVAALVEFGSHAGNRHTTPILRYRVFGITSDILGSRV